MYNYFIYLEKSTSSARFNAASIVTLGIFIYTLLILSILKKIFTGIHTIMQLLNTYEIFLVLLLLGIGVIIYSYYNQNRIERHAEIDRYSNSIPHKLLVFTIIIVPLVIVAILSRITI